MSRREDFVYSDFLLIKKMKQGDDAAFDIFVRKYYLEILTYCYYHCPDKDYAEDLTQETYVRFFTKLSDYHHKGKALNYLYTIAGNLCRDYIKKVKEIPMEEMEFAEDKNSEQYQTENILNKIFVEQTLQQLPDELREILTLYYFQELKLTEIARTLQIGIPLVKYRLGRGKKLLKELLRKEENYERGETSKDE